MSGCKVAFHADVDTQQSKMPLQQQAYDGDLGLPVPPADQDSVRLQDLADESLEPQRFRLLQEFKYPPVHLDAYDLYMYVHKEWQLRASDLSTSRRLLIGPRPSYLALTPHIIMAAFVLRWVANFEAWMRLCFLRDIFNLPTGAGTTPRPHTSDQNLLLDRFGDLWDMVTRTMRYSLVQVHYTDSRDDSDVLLPFYSDKTLNYQVYVASTNKVLTVVDHFHHREEERTPLMGLTRWDHRRIILSTQPIIRQGVQWFYQDRDEMKEWARRYPDPSVLLPGRGPYMPPAVQFR